jgi:hypothetical protein
MILLSPAILTLMIAEGVLLILAFIALLASLRIGIDFDPTKTTAYQYELNKKSYLVATIIMFVLLLKLPLFFFFIWGLDATALLVPGAMCAAGIVGATSWGTWMFFIKILTLFLLSGWVLMHRQDLQTTNFAYTKIKFLLYQGLFFVLCVEFLVQLAHYIAMPIDTPVHCCSVLFDQSSSMGAFSSQATLLALFYGLFALLVIVRYLRMAWLFGIFSFLWGAIGVVALIQFFTPYVYELPTHKCPFCILQAEYFYIGYLIYTLMFLGGLGGLGVMVLRALKREVSPLWYNLGLTCNALLLLLLTAYPLSYYLRNGVWL